MNKMKNWLQLILMSAQFTKIKEMPVKRWNITRKHWLLSKKYLEKNIIQQRLVTATLVQFTKVKEMLVKRWNITRKH